MCLQIPPDLDNSTTMLPAAADDFSFHDATIELHRLIRLCDIGLRCGDLYRLRKMQRRASKNAQFRQLKLLRSYCDDMLSHISEAKLYYSRQQLHKMVLSLRKDGEEAYTDAVSGLVIFSISSAVKGGIYVNIGSHRICAPDNLRVNHPLLQMVLFATNLHGDSFSCLKSMAPKSIARMAKTSGSSASPTEYIADWISANWESDSPNAVTNPPCGSKKPLLPVLFNISASKKTSNTVYDSSMTVAAGDCGVSYKSNLELGKASNRLLFREESNDCQQHSALTGGNHDARLQVAMAQEVACICSISLDKMPTAAGSVKCGDADESTMLTKQTSPQQQFVLNSSGDGGSGNPCSNSTLRVTPFAETTLTPMVPKPIEVDPQHMRKIDLTSEVDILEAIHMMNGSQRINTDGQMHYVFILDSGSPEHCTGDISQLSDYRTEVRPDRYLRGAGGTLMRVHGTGSIRNENFQVQGVLYVPGLNNQPNINKTIFSVAKLNELGYSILFNPDGTSFVIDNSNWTWKHEIIGKARKDYGNFMLDYLRIPLNRAPMPMFEGPGLLKSLRNASLSVWRSITGHLSQRTICAQRPPV